MRCEGQAELVSVKKKKKKKKLKGLVKNIKSSLLKEQGSETLSWRTEQFWWTLFKGRN